MAIGTVAVFARTWVKRLLRSAISDAQARGSRWKSPSERFYLGLSPRYIGNNFVSIDKNEVLATPHQKKVLCLAPSFPQDSFGMHIYYKSLRFGVDFTCILHFASPVVSFHSNEKIVQKQILSW